MRCWLHSNIADQLQRRIAYRRAMKRAIQQAMKQGAGGIKILKLVVVWLARKCPVTYGCVKVACLCKPCAQIMDFATR
jgi:ribosomal protein S3